MSDDNDMQRREIPETDLRPSPSENGAPGDSRRNRAPGGPVGNSKHRTHGLHTLKKAVKELGSRRVIDRRTKVGRALAAWRHEITEDLGELSAREDSVVGVLVLRKLLLDSVGAWIATQRNLINRRNKSVHPVVREWSALADAFVRDLQVLGLKRRPPDPMDLRRYLLEREQAPSAPVADTPATPPSAPPDSRDDR